MKYDEYKNEINELLEKELLIWKQTHVMFIPISNKLLNDNPTNEPTRVRYDITNVWDEYVFKENKVLFFIDKYLNNMLHGISNMLDIIDTESNSTFMIPTANSPIEEAVYYFDAFISFFSTLIESDQKDTLCKYLNSKEINKIFPTRENIGLYWQIYMLRNRIIHFTNGKYANSTKECIRFQEFSSKIISINITNKNELHAYSTLIDINKSEQAKKAINMAINNKNINPFDALFPNQSAKGYGKKKPFINVICDDIFFDHIDSSVIIINQILDILCTINKLFFKQLINKNDRKEEILNSKALIMFNDENIECYIKDVFN